MAFEPHQLDEIRARISVSDVVGSHFQIMKHGSEYVVKDNTSFTINDKKQFWCEFGSGGDGNPHDIFDFLQIYGGLTFISAVEELAKRAGIDLKQRPGRANGANGHDHAAYRDNEGSGSDRHAAASTRADATSPGKREIVATWDYLDPENSLLYQVVRMQEKLPDGSWRKNREGKTWKTFMQRRPAGDGTWILGLDVIDRETGQPLEFLKTEKSTAWLRATEERLQWRGVTTRTFVELGNVDHWLYNANGVIDEMAEPKDDQRTIFLCYTGDTEVLTRLGWVSFDRLESQQVAQWHMETGEISFCQPIAKQEFNYSGDLVSMKATWCDLLVTPNHRQPAFYITAGVKYGPTVLPASDVRQMHHLPVSGIALGEGGPSEPLARLISCWLADGINQKTGTQTFWNLKKPRKKIRLRELLSEAGIAWREKEVVHAPGWTRFSVSRSDLPIWGFIDDKRWSWDALNWSERSRHAAIIELAFWDGDSVETSGRNRRNHSFRYFTGDEQSANVISAMAAISGYGSIMRVDRRDGKNHSYTVNLLPKTWRSMSKTPSRVPYQGKVFCCSVPSTFLVVRRNGKVVISGNCEGEGKVDVLKEWGLLGITNSGGAKHFTENCAEFFRGARHVVLLQDNDRAGAERVAKIGPMLKAVGVELVQALNFRDVWPACPVKGDVKDWREQGGTKDQLLEIVEELKPWTPEPYKSKFGAKTARDLGAAVRAYPWRIKGIMPMYDNMLLMGPSRSGKTFECLDMVMHVHNGQPFAGRKVVPAGFVYLTYEGATGFENRLRAYLKHHEMSIDDLHSFAWLTRPPNMFASEDNLVALAEEIVKIAEGFRLPLGGTIVDTHNSATRGSSEIKSDDMNRIMTNYDIVKEKTGAPLIVIGHTNSEGRHRGNEQFFNNIETAILIERVYTDAKHTIEKRDDDGKVIRRGKIMKQREGDDRTTWEFVLREVVIGTDEDGEPIPSMVSVEPAQQIPQEVSEQYTTRDRPDGFYLKGNHIDVFRALLKAIETIGKPAPAELALPSSVGNVIKWTDLGLEYKKTDPQEADESLEKYRTRLKARLRRFREELLKYNVIGIAEMRDLTAPVTDIDKPKMIHFVWPTGRRVYGKGLTWPPLPKKKKEQPMILAPGETGLPPDVF